jgi:alkylation response protein AidB-like acyl-CoA dehydrogenase
MSFDLDELSLVRTSLRHVIDSNTPGDVPGALITAGWNELVDTDPAAAITALSEQAGAARSPAPVTDLAILWGAGIEADATTAVVIGGLALAGAERAERFVVVGDGAITEWATVELAPAGGFDPMFGLQHAQVGGAGSRLGGPEQASRAIAAGRRSLASQMTAACDQMLADTLAYVVERQQYRRPIGSFQSVKHRLADVKVAAAAARSGVSTAWEHAASPHADVAAMAAKCLAGRAQQLASTHCFQVHGGIAFTVEHGFQQWVRRGLMLDFLLGGHEQLTPELGRRLISAGVVPRVPHLH